MTQVNRVLKRKLIIWSALMKKVNGTSFCELGEEFNIVVCCSIFSITVSTSLKLLCVASNTLRTSVNLGERFVREEP